jgi:hypothetical protein
MKDSLPKAKREQMGQEAGQQAMSETQKALRVADLGLSRGLIKLNQLLDATKPISCIKGKDADGGSVDFVDVPDNQTQIKALDILLTLGDHYPAKQIKADVNHSGSLMADVVEYLSNPEKPVTNDKHKVKKSSPTSK